MTTRSAVLLGAVLVLAVAGCGSSKPSTAPTPTAPALTPTVAIGKAMAVGVPEGWVVQRSAIDHGSGSVCLLPKGSTQLVFGCAGVAFDFGPHLPGAHSDPYASDQPDGWFSATDVEPCPFVKHELTDVKVVGITTKAGFDRGLKPVGAHRADWNRWTTSCAGRTFHPQAWFLPTSKVVVFDYLDHPQTASILASALFANDGVALPAAPTYLSAHVLSGTDTTLVVRPFRTYTTDAKAKAYAAAHGLEFPFPDDYLDADFGARRTIVLDASTSCAGGLDLGQDIPGTPVPCAAFGAYGQRLPAGIWLRPGTSTAESVIEIFRP